MSESEVTVPVKYIGNDDIARHIKAPRSKKPTTQRGKSALSTKFVESTINDPINRGSKKDKFKTLPDEPPLVATSVGSDALLESNMDRSGTNVYSFKTPKRSKQMNKFAESARKKHEEAGIKNGGMKQNETSNEQIVTRNQYSLQTNQQTDDSSSETDLTSDSSGNETNERDNTDEQQPKQHRTAGGLQLPSERELYFDTHGGKKNQKQLSKTSDHTLQSLKTPQLNPDQLSNALSKHSHQSGKMKEVQEVVAAQNLLCDHHKQMFTKWLFNLCNDFNIILYGLGSKRQLMHAFCSKHLKKQSKLVVNGFFPSLSIKSVLMSICEDIIQHTTSFSNTELQFQQICNHYSTDKNTDHLFLVIHNIDGMCLRNLKAQTVLSQLALCSRIHLVASIDHINAPLIWDQTMLSRFNWLWYDVTTFSPYREETSYEGSLLLSGAGTGLGARGAALALSGLLHVARSLTSNARGVFQILAEHQISLEKEKGDENEDATYEDLSFSELYQKCRERFLVNSELTLRAHLTEFLDHKLVQMRKGADGGEYLSVPLDIGTLKEYLEKEESR